jgi:1-deoxy-D-xylulose-5-phosphate reductoisomerase
MVNIESNTTNPTAYFALASQAMQQPRSHAPIGLAILGSTGSIGTQTLKVVTHFSEQFKIIALAAGSSQLSVFAQQLLTFHPLLACVPTEEDRQQLLLLLNGVYRGQLLVGEAEGLEIIAQHEAVDKVIVGLVGSRGVSPTLAALKAGKLVLTANKETFVSAGHLIQPYLSQVVPFDSEHSALFQCLCPHKTPQQVEALWLTASGGAFRTFTAKQLAEITPQQALKHPNWQMGAKVTVDSASLMNKGLEVIEAYWLYGIAPEKIKVVVHPQSIVHSMVEFVDGSFSASLGPTDMCVPIQYALSYPYHWGNIPMVKRLDLLALSRLDFEPPNRELFPCLALAEDCLTRGAWATATLNKADELAVAAFLAGRIGFMQIPIVIERALTLVEQAGWHQTQIDLEALLALEAFIEERTSDWLLA